ncbi:TPA: LysR substrate-binding domain-containing protein [Serratia fonticola]|uniref:LysR substrate-binding domain-containing protein n=1 Tax=Serratia fonticola TaxID=47917 RepID=UPI00217BEF83|nr:LysR substrate-binding domain-containing protein [Serratia fonticola]CAI0744355.1 HTH-type transcriptional regulator AbgR [Serratia fonticola]
MRYLPKLQQLQTFQSVLLHGSIRTAAKALGQSQPGVTRSLQELEQILGISLMTRGSTGVVLTDIGRLFNSRIELILNELDRALDEIEHHIHSVSGPVTIGLSLLPILTIFPGAIKRFKTKHPTSCVTNVEGQISELLPGLRNGKLDFIICAHAPLEYLGGLIQEPLIDTQYFIYARKGHLLAHCTSLVELQDADWFLPVTKIGYYNQLEQILFKSDNDKNKSIMRGTGSAALQMVMNADYLTIATSQMIRNNFLKQELCIIQVKEMLPAAKFCLVYSSERPLTLAAKNLMHEFRLESQYYDWSEPITSATLS